MKLKIYLVILISVILILNCKTESEIDYEQLRKLMVANQIVGRGIKDKKVIDAMLKVPRHLFIPKEYRSEAYSDHPVPIGEGQTISQPYMVALMTEALKLKGNEKVLEIGTGSGYQAAILAEIVKEVYTIEIIEKLARRAEKVLKNLGYKNVHVIVGDGFKGLPDKAPFDAIIVTCAPSKIPKPLIEQLKIGGRMVIPVDNPYGTQTLKRITKTKEGLKSENLGTCLFVPFVNKEGKKY